MKNRGGGGGMCEVGVWSLGSKEDFQTKVMHGFKTVCVNRRLPFEHDVS